MIGYETDEIIEERFKFLLQKYQEGLKEKMKKKIMVVLIYVLKASKN